MEIYEEAGQIDTINIFFESPVQNRVTALALLGLQPSNKAPTREVPAFYAWERIYEGIGEVRALRQPLGGAAIRGMNVKP